MADAVAVSGRTDGEEVRFAVVLNGGVSLAVWMGGVVHEIDAATHGYDAKDERPTHAYARLMGELGVRARADVITGTSAGGINGAALALAQVNRSADVGILRDLWAEQGRMETLLQRPFSGEPASLLRGEEYFLPRLEEAMGALAARWDARNHKQRPVDLTVTATLLSGALQLSTDSTGAVLPQRRHDGHFRFRRGVDDQPDTLDAANDPDVPRRLALAARCSAGFPGAFEPSYVPVNRDQPLKDRPDMGDGVASWTGFVRDGDERDLSRFAVDGGVLANTPTKQALDAIQSMKAREEVQRVMLLVYPHAPSDVADEPDKIKERPPLAGSLASLLTALRADGGRTHVERVEEHNRRAAARRTTRAEILRGRDGGNPLLDLLNLSDELYFVYRRQRIVRAARDLPQRIDLPRGWSFERTRAACLAAQEARPDVPYAPREPDFEDLPANRWIWGASAALDLADIALEVTDELRRAGRGSAEVDGSVATIHDSMAVIRDVRRVLDERWKGGPDQVPDTAYWEERLAGYEAYMCAPGSAGGEPTVGAAGRVVDAILRLEPWTALGDSAWQTLFRDLDKRGETGPDRRSQLFSRLMRLHVVSWCVGDEFTENNTRPIELVQLSAQTRNDFATYSLSMEDKLGSESLGRFSGFLRTSWRMNDWAWGRLDGATHLFRILLTPARVQAYVAARVDERGSVADVVDHLVQTVLGTELPEQGEAGLRLLHADAVAEVRLLFKGTDGKVEPARPLVPRQVVDTEPLAALPALLTYARHAETVVEDLPAVAAGVRVDLADGAGERSVGAVFLAQSTDLLARLDQLRRDEGHVITPQARLRLGLEALRALDRAGIGREGLRAAASSDQLIRTAVTGVAVATTLVDSPAAGIGKLKPVTRLLRGAMMLPYWVTLGLTSSGAIARSLAMLGLTVGGALIALAVLGVVPLSGVWTAVGAGVLLFCFAYAAARTGSTLHSFAFLTGALIAVLMALSESHRALPERSVTALAVLVVIGAVIVLGSIPNPMLSPASLVMRRVGNLAMLVVVAAGLVAAFVVDPDDLIAAYDAVTGVLVDGVQWAQDRPGLIVILAVVGVAVAALLAHFLTRMLSPIAWGRPRNALGREQDGPLRWTRQPISHPSSLFGAWSWVYGTAYLAVALVVGLNRWVAPGWVALLAVLAVGFALVAPVLVVLLARSRVVRRAQAFVDADASARRTSPELVDDDTFARWLVTRGWGLAFLLKEAESDAEVPRLTSRGLRLRRALTARSGVSVGPSGPGA